MRKGELLYASIRKPLEAALAPGARPNWRRRRRGSRRRRTTSKRYTPLAAKQAVSQQELDNALAAQEAARAQVEAAKAGGREGDARSGLHPRHLADRRAGRHHAGQAGQPRRPRREHAAHDHLADRPDPVPRRRQRGGLPAPRAGAPKRVGASAAQPCRHRADAGRRHGPSAEGPARRRSSAPSIRTTGTLGVQFRFPNPSGCSVPASTGGRVRPRDQGRARCSCRSGPCRSCRTCTTSRVVGSDNKVAFRTVTVGPRVEHALGDRRGPQAGRAGGRRRAAADARRHCRHGRSRRPPTRRRSADAGRPREAK